MSQTKTKEELVRLAWLTRLRVEGYRQCQSQLRVGPYVCALGMLAMVVGIPVEDGADDLEIGYRLGSLAGLDNEQVDAVVGMNDGHCVRKYAFAEIAHVVSGWFTESANKEEQMILV